MKWLCTYLLIPLLCVFTSQSLSPTFQYDLSLLPTAQSILITTMSSLDAKLSLAQQVHRDTLIGSDLVAHGINELIAHGAIPLFFATYCANDGVQTKELMEGITNSCKRSNCSLVSYTSELQKVVQPHHYDIAGFAAGMVSKQRPLQKPLHCGDIIIGLPTNGIHASSFAHLQSLIDHYNMDIMVEAPFITHHAYLADALLAPLTIYPAILTFFHKHIKALAQVTQGGLYGTLARIVPEPLSAQISLYRWPIPPMFRWIKQIAQHNVYQMAQTYNLGIGMIAIVAPSEVDEFITLCQQHNLPALIIGSLEARQSSTAPVTITGTMGSTYSRVLIIGDSAQEHALAWKLAQSPCIERIFVAPGNGGTSTEKKIQNIPVNPLHHGALIAYVQQNNIDMVIVTKTELCAHGMVDEFTKAGIVCLGPTKKAIRVASTAQEFMQRHAIPCYKGTPPTSPVHYSVITDGTTIVPLTSCQLYQTHEIITGACSPASAITPIIEKRILENIIKLIIKGLKAEGISLQGFLAVDLVLTDQATPRVTSLHFDMHPAAAATIMMRLDTDLFKVCYSAAHQQLHNLTCTWHAQPSLSIALNTTAPSEVIVGVPEDSLTTKVFHTHTTYKNGQYSTTGQQPLYIAALGDTLEKARNTAYRTAQQLYWPSMEYRKDVGYWEIAQQKH